MKQMVRPEAPVVAKVEYNTIAAGFYRDCQGRIFFAFARHGKGPTYAWPVYDNGTISRHCHGSKIPYPTTEVEIIHPRDLGIDEIVYADDLKI